MTIQKLLVANRGEIAVRVVRTCADLGITSVAVHSVPDAKALHVRLADEAVDLGGTSAPENYLDIDSIVQAARDTGAQAIHPGYGFLAENAAFARAVTEAGLIFVGPSGYAIEVMGEKVAARQLARKAGVPHVPGTTGPVTSDKEVIDFGKTHGFPLVVKASYGGGGRGMRLVAEPLEATQALESARREAEAAFGHPDVYVERYLERARHVEVQVFADQYGTTLWLGDRDCSVQRRHQKLVEESPAPGLSDELRREMGEAAVRLARAVDYIGAGTVEFLVEDEQFYFLEMNTRIQVEHPVTEMVLGLDLVAEQIRVADGEPLSLRESGPTPRGHAIECRLNAEDVHDGLFAPSAGGLTALAVPATPGVRADLGYEAGDEVPPLYDSMIGKLVVWGPDRPTAIRRTLTALDTTVIEGVPTTIPAAQAVVSHSDFATVTFDTQWLEREVTFPGRDAADESETGAASGGAEAEGDLAESRDEVWVGGRRYVVPFFTKNSAAGGAAPSGAQVSGRKGPARGSSRGRARRGAAAGDGSVVSPMQGTVTTVSVEPGSFVDVGQVLFVVEAMKMENPVRATVAGTVAEVVVAPGDTVTAGASLAQITPASDTNGQNTDGRNTGEQA